MKIALIIGHNKRSKGAYSQIVGSEYDYWKRVAEKIKTVVPELVDIYEREPNEYYTREMYKVLEELNSKDYKLCIELHFNAAENKTANGCECLVYYTNDKAKKLATNFMARLQNVFGSKIRGRNGIIEIQDSKVRGGYGICKSKDTYILVEPFFGTNNDESLKYSVESDFVNLFLNFIKEI